MRALLWLVLALCLSVSAQAQVYFDDGYEKGESMAVTDWVEVIGPKDGTVKETWSAPPGETPIGVSLFTPPFDALLLPSTPGVIISGFEVRISAVASHSGVSVSKIFVDSSLAQSSGSMGVKYITAQQPTTSPDFNVGTSGDLGATDFIAAGGFDFLVPKSKIQSSVGPALSGVNSVHPMTRADWWTEATFVAVGEPLDPYLRESDSMLIYLTSDDGWTASVLVDSVQIRLFYDVGDYAKLAGSGTVSATISKARPITAALSGSGVAAGALNAKRVLSAGMSGSGRISTVISSDSGGTIRRYLMPELIGTGAMSVTPLVRYAPIPAAMSGSGSMTTNVSIGKNICAPSRNGTLALRGSGVLAGSPKAKKAIARDLTGSGTISMTLKKQRPIAAALSGAGIGSVAMIGKRQVAAAMSGSGSVAVTLQRKRPFTAALNGSGQVAATVLVRKPIAANLSGSGEVTINESLITSNTRLRAGESRTFTAPSRNRVFEVPSRVTVFEVT